MATVRDIKRKQGDTYPVEATILDSDGTAYDLTGASSVQFGVATAEGEPPTFVVTGAVTDAVAGKAEFAIGAGEAATAVGKYRAEIQIVAAGFIITTETFGYEVVGQIVT